MKYILILLLFVACSKQECEEKIVNIEINKQCAVNSNGIITVINNTNCKAQVYINNEMSLQESNSTNTYTILKDQSYKIIQLNYVYYDEMNDSTICIPCQEEITATYKNICND